MNKLAIALVLFATPALAQQQQQQTVQEQLLSAYSGISMSLAKQLDAANAQIADLQKQLTDERAKNRDPREKSDQPK